MGFVASLMIRRPNPKPKNQIDSQVGAADVGGKAEEQFQLFDGRVVIAHHGVGAREISTG